MITIWIKWSKHKTFKNNTKTRKDPLHLLKHGYVKLVLFLFFFFLKKQIYFTYCINLSHPGSQTWWFLRWRPPGSRSQAPRKRDPLPLHCWLSELLPSATSLRKDTTDCLFGTNGEYLYPTCFIHVFVWNWLATPLKMFALRHDCWGIVMDRIHFTINVDSRVHHLASNFLKDVQI